MLHIFDAALCAVKVTASFYKLQYKHIKLRCGKLCTRVWFQFPGGMFPPRIGKIGRRLTKLSQI